MAQKMSEFRVPSVHWFVRLGRVDMKGEGAGLYRGMPWVVFCCSTMPDAEAKTRSFKPPPLFHTRVCSNLILMSFRGVSGATSACSQNFTHAASRCLSAETRPERLLQRFDWLPLQCPEMAWFRAKAKKQETVTVTVFAPRKPLQSSLFDPKNRYSNGRDALGGPSARLGATTGQ